MTACRDGRGRGRGRVLALGLGAIALTALIPIVVLALLLNGGGSDDDEPAPDAADARAAQALAAFPLYWAGESVAGLPLTRVLRTGRQFSFIYGTCTPTGDSGCPSPVEIQTTSLCDRNPLVLDGRVRSSRTVRGVAARDYGDGDPSLETGASHVTLFAYPEFRERALAALRAVGDPAPSAASGAADLPAPRYPLAYVISLRLVRDAYRRLGSVRAVRDEIGISQSAVRQRLRYARELGGRRLRRPATQFVREGDCRLEPAP